MGWEGKIEDQNNVQMDVDEIETDQLQTDQNGSTSSVLLDPPNTLDSNAAEEHSSKKRGSEEQDTDDEFVEARRYGLRDRSKIKKAEKTPTILGQCQSEAPSRGRDVRTYGRRSSRRGRGRGKGVEDWSSWNMVRSSTLISFVNV